MSDMISKIEWRTPVANRLLDVAKDMHSADNAKVLSTLAHQVAQIELAAWHRAEEDNAMSRAAAALVRR